MADGGGFVITTLPETQAFWDQVAQERFVMPKCNRCGSHYFPPSPVCQKCCSKDVGLEPVSGRATLYSYVIAQNPWPDWHAQGPMSVALVLLEEGVMLTSMIVECPQTPAALFIDMPLVATFKEFGSRKLLCFKPQSR